MDFCSILGPLTKTGLPLTKHVLTPPAKKVLIPIKLIASSSAADTRTHHISFGSEIHGLNTATLITLNKEMEDIMKNVQSLS